MLSCAHASQILDSVGPAVESLRRLAFLRLGVDSPFEGGAADNEPWRLPASLTQLTVRLQPNAAMPLVASAPGLRLLDCHLENSGLRALLLAASRTLTELVLWPHDKCLAVATVEALLACRCASCCQHSFAVRFSFGASCGAVR
jgi:hypothetical protein